VNRLLDNRELIRRLKEGSPIEVEDEVVRLPRFSEIRESEPNDFGVAGSHELIVAKARTATWCVWPLDRKARFSLKDGKTFVKILAAIGEALPHKPVKGWVLTTAPVGDDTRAYLEEAGHRINRISG
jgi:hypothetical protein